MKNNVTDKDKIKMLELEIENLKLKLEVAEFWLRDMNIDKYKQDVPGKDTFSSSEPLQF